jgi:hypothetical protein
VTTYALELLLQVHIVIVCSYFPIRRVSETPSARAHPATPGNQVSQPTRRRPHRTRTGRVAAQRSLCSGSARFVDARVPRTYCVVSA